MRDVSGSALLIRRLTVCHDDADDHDDDNGNSCNHSADAPADDAAADDAADAMLIADVSPKRIWVAAMMMRERASGKRASRGSIEISTFTLEPVMRETRQSFGIRLLKKISNDP